MEHQASVTTLPTSLDQVRCLGCGSSYAKPTDGGTVHENPGCPTCGYLGWISVTASPTADREPHRSDEDRLLRRAAQSR